MLYQGPHYGHNQDNEETKVHSDHKNQPPNPLLIHHPSPFVTPSHAEQPIRQALRLPTFLSLEFMGLVGRRNLRLLPRLLPPKPAPVPLYLLAQLHEPNGLLQSKPRRQQPFGVKPELDNSEPPPKHTFLLPRPPQLHLTPKNHRQIDSLSKLYHLEQE